jgi:hypothetical protein
LIDHQAHAFHQGDEQINIRGRVRLGGDFFADYEEAEGLVLGPQRETESGMELAKLFPCRFFDGRFTGTKEVRSYRQIFASLRLEVLKDRRARFEVRQLPRAALRVGATISKTRRVSSRKMI